MLGSKHLDSVCPVVAGSGRKHPSPTRPIPNRFFKFIFIFWFFETRFPCVDDHLPLRSEIKGMSPQGWLNSHPLSTTPRAPGAGLNNSLRVDKTSPQPPLPHCLKVRFREQSWVLETVPLASSYPLSSCEGKRRCAKGGRLHCPGTQPIDHAGNPKTPLHADTGQAALGPLQPHIQVTPGPARSVGQAITRTLPPTLILTYYHRPPTPGSSPFPGTC